MRVKVNGLIIALIASMWWAIGLAGFLFWYTYDPNDYDVGAREIVFGSIMAVMGPLTWLIGWFIHG